MGYSGNASFVFEIERYLNKQTGKLMLDDEAGAEAAAHPFGEGWWDINYEYQVIPLDIEGSAYYQEGKHYGPPENCYPDEGEVEITSVIGPDSQDWHSKLTQNETDRIIEMIQDHVVDSADGPDEDDYYEDDDYYDDGDI